MHGSLRVLAVSGSRADWGLLRPVLQAIRAEPGLQLQLAVTGQHLAPGTAGDVDRLLAADGFTATHRIDMGLTADDSPGAIGGAMGRGLSGMAAALAKSRPDLMLVLGDRYEILAAVSAAQVARVPVAHIAGGDITEGAFDDAIRHAITKLSALHFTTNAEAQGRVIQMGEDPARVFLTGSPGIDAILEVPRLTRAELLASVGLSPNRGADEPDPRRLLLVTLHPATLSSDNERHCAALLSALEGFADADILFTGSNADPGAQALDAMIRAAADRLPHAVFHHSLGSQRYFSALAIADAVIGNSSSGLYEAPSFGLPTVNIGDRQARRPRAETVIDCAPEVETIRTAIGTALARGRVADAVNTYGDGQAAQRITAILAAITDPAALVRKSFCDIPAALQD